jgi:glycosyltransferase involved in cell wall biosynthesis
MKISIITVCKNAEDIIKRTVESVLSQTYRDIEYIVVDGGSSDGTVERVEEFIAAKLQVETAEPLVEEFRSLGGRATSLGVEAAEPLVELNATFGCSNSLHLLSEPDTGIYNAMNKGINLATGDVLYFLNAGDELFDEKVVSAVMSEFERDDTDAVYGDVLIKRDSGADYRKSMKKLSKYIFLIDTVNHQSIFMKTDIVRKNGNFNERYKIVADYDLLLKMFFDGNTKIKYIPLIIASYPDDGMSSLFKNFKELQKERSLIQGTYFSKFEKFMVKLPMVKKIIRYIWGLQCHRYQ